MKDWLIIALLALAAALVFHAVFPRYDWSTQTNDTVVVYDRWQGRFQRAAFNNDGSLNLSDVFQPF